MDLLPPNAEDIKKIVKARIAAWEEGLKETYVLEDWRGTRNPIPVIHIPVDIPYYNPHSRRIQAQKGIDPVRARVLEEHPFSQEAQSYLDDLLQWDPASPRKVNPLFERLKEDLARPKGQKKPGLMTRDGVLVNGNTRCAALRKIGAQNILVAILPEDTCREDIDRLEVDLQIGKDIQIDYSFVNGLLAVSDYVKRGVPHAEVRKIFGMRQPRLDRSLWLLDFIDQAIARSATTDGEGNTVSLGRHDFERDQGQLEELYRAWNELDSKDPDKASLLKENRLVGVVLNLAKTDLRVIHNDFFSRYLAPKLDQRYLPEIPVQEEESVPGLEDVKLPAPSQELLQARALADSVLQAEAIKRQAPLGSTPPPETTRLLNDVDKAYRAGKQLAQIDDEAKKKGQTPGTRIILGSDQLDIATTSVAAATAIRNLDIQGVEDALETLRQSMTRLAQVLSRVEKSDEMDVGFSWLQAAVNVDPRSFEDDRDGS